MTRTASGDFWSRRRAAVAAEAEAEARAETDHDAARESTALSARDDAEILAELDLPDPDSLQPGDDVTGFMARAVPDRLRRRALRRLWRSNPVLANIDGLVDYGEDFTDAATVVETLQSAYQVGRGMVAHVEELARRAEGDQSAGEQSVPDVSETAAPEEHGEPGTAVGVEPAAPSAPRAATDDVAAVAPPAPRRMRFRFEQEA